ncbi:MAG: sodium-dependent transporter [Bacteroidales bacterium]|nr:sodium-dependent transporter [Bacteroidales bacterium]MBR6540948.1 sodium-dependent transporter [Bacteroidales bacterium]
MANRDGFASSFGVLVAMAGSAVGLGNLWRFPYLVGTNGGAAFIVIYLAIVFLLAIPIMYAEFVIGRRAQTDVFGAFKKLAPGSKWGIIGIISIVCCTIILGFYVVVGGWTIDYMVKACMQQFSSANADFTQMFASSVQSSYSPLIYMLVFTLLSGGVLLAGVKDGIEKYSKILMPALFIIVVILAIRSVTLPNSGAGVEFMFKPDFSKVTTDTFLDALGQAFFSLSVGFGIIFTYASYVNRKESIIKMSAQTAIADTLFAILAGVAIMPAVFAFGLEPGQGPGLLFVTIPYIFSQLPLGSVLAVLFFFVLFVAAITSSISLLEVVVAYLIEEFKLKRRNAVITVVLVVTLIGVFCSLSQGVLSDVKIFGLNIFDLLDYTSANILIPLGAMLIVLFAGWRMSKADFIDEITSGGERKVKSWYLTVILMSIKYLAPVVIGVIMVRGLFF